MVRTMDNAKCGACGGTLEVTRYKSGGYDHPPHSFKVPCPLCVGLRARPVIRPGLAPLPFPMQPARGKN